MRCKGAILIGLLSCSYAQAQVREIQPMSFGSVVILDNSSVQSISIDELGNISYSSGIRIVQPGNPGIIEGLGYPANAQLFVTANVAQGNTNSTVYSPEQFVLSTLHTATSVITESDGSFQLVVGGTLQTSGSGSRNFADTDYSATLTITVNF